MMRSARRSLLFGAVYAVCVIALVIGAWAIAAAAIGKSYILPSVSEIWYALGDVLKLRLFWKSLAGTLWRGIIGFAISLALSGACYYFSTAYKTFRRLVEPFVSALRSLPAVAITLVLAIAVGGFGTPIVLAVLVIFPIMYSAAMARVATVPRELYEVCALCGASKPRTFAALWFPSLAGALPEICSTAFSYNIKTVIGAEILAQTAASLGMLMRLSEQYYETAMLVAFVVIAVVVSIVLERVIYIVLKFGLARYID